MCYLFRLLLRTVVGTHGLARCGNNSPGTATHQRKNTYVVQGTHCPVYFLTVPNRALKNRAVAQKGYLLLLLTNTLSFSLRAHTHSRARTHPRARARSHTRPPSGVLVQIRSSVAVGLKSRIPRVQHYGNIRPGNVFYIQMQTLVDLMGHCRRK